MLFKPFKVPSQRQPSVHNDAISDDSSEGPRKRRRISDNTSQQDRGPSSQPSSPPRTSQVTSSFRQPLSGVAHSSQKSQPPIDTGADGAPSTGNYFSILWRKVTNKKHKIWDGDGTLSVVGGYATLRDERGKVMGRTTCKAPLLPGSTLSISGKEVEIDSAISKGNILDDQTENSKQDFKLPTSHRSLEPLQRTNLRPTKIPLELSQPATKETFRPSSVSTSLLQRAVAESNARVKEEKAPVSVARAPQRKDVKTNGTKAKARAFQSPLLDKPEQLATNSKVPTPRHDPHADGALVMKQPGSVPQGKQVVDVVVDPFLSKHLREHQRVGVSFLYECVMGIRSKEGEGAILADEMGLGKSLQTIALLWTLLKQNSTHGDPPIARKAVIVCPASVVNNWRKEIRKWLGRERIGVMVADDKSRISSFTRGKSYQILIVGYEKLVKIQVDLQRCSEIDVVVADEGHRLKTAKNQAAAAIKSIDTERRIVLTGTLLQNNLSEWYFVVDLVNPGLLGKYSSFKKDFENPIMRGRQDDATEDEKEKAREREEELKAITGPFILRRSADILSKYLPPKTEFVLFCRPTQIQADIYDAILKSPILGSALNNSELSFQLISVLKKVCNIPSLLVREKAEGHEESIADAIATSITHKKLKSANTSGKLRALDDLLHQIHHTTEEKVVVISNYTATLDLIANMLTGCDYRFLRLDGSTPAAKRQDLVDLFNRTPQQKNFVFLLSTKAGGMGLNLIGASRLVLFDIDWNPALDQQAMARICRDGQKRPCFIYRLLTKGGLDEKIFQRQVMKLGLADSVVDNKKGASNFSKAELRNLFNLDRGEGCRTHELLGCACGEDGTLPTEVGDEEAVDGKGLKDDEESLPDADDVVKGLPSWMSASQFEREEHAREDKARSASSVKKSQMLGLMQYSHLNAKKLRQRHSQQQIDSDGSKTIASGDGEGEEETTDVENAGSDVVEDVDDANDDLGVPDDVLRAVILQDGSPIDYAFAKVGKGQTAESMGE